MCIDRAYTGADRWIKILQHVKPYDINIQKEVFEKLVFICKKMNDEEKIRIKNEIRYEIFRHRYFGDLFQISCSVCRCVGGEYLVVKVRGKLTLSLIHISPLSMRGLLSVRWKSEVSRRISAT